MTLSPMFLFSLAAKATAILAVAGVVTLALRRESAAVRHSIWSFALTGVLALPFLSLTLPRWRVAPMPELLARPRAARAPTVAAVAAPARAPRLAPAADGGPRIAPAPGWIAAPRLRAGRSAPIVAAPAVAPVIAPPAAGWSAASIAIGGWIGGVVLFLLWIVVGELWIRRFGRGARPATAPEWTDLMPEALEALGVAQRVRLLETDRSIVPMTYGVFHPVVLVPAAGRAWARPHRRDVLLHELAHVARRDYLTHFIGRVTRAFHWFNPLAWLALRQLRIEREHASDDAVLNAGVLPSRYAEELLSTAQAMIASPRMAAGLGIARRSELADRLLSVLDPNRRRSALDRWSWAGLAGSSLAFILPVAALGQRAPGSPPAPPQPARPVVAAPAAAPLPVAAPLPAEAPEPVANPAPAAPAAPVEFSGPVAPAALAGPTRPVQPVAPPLWTAISSLVTAPAPPTPALKPSVCPPDPNGKAKRVSVSSSISISGNGTASDGDNSWVVWSGADCSVTIRTNGTITFDDDERDVKSLSHGGRFVVTHEDGDRRRIYSVRPGGGGLEREYLIDGKPAPMDSDFEGWRADIVLEYIRRSAYDAERRARRILAARGVDGLLAEIAEVPTDWGKGQYFRALLKSASIDDATATRLVDQAGRSIESDYELGRVLAALSPVHLQSEPVRQAFVRAAGTMDSDYEKRKLLAAVLAAGKPDSAVTGAMLDLASTIGSDYEVAELLVGLASSGAVTGGFDPAYLKALRTIESDYQKHRVLTALVAGGPRPPATLAAALEAAATIESDYELASFLVEVADRGLVTKDLRPLYRRAIATIESTHQRQRALAALGARDAEI